MGHQEDGKMTKTKDERTRGGEQDLVNPCIGEAGCQAPGNHTTPGETRWDQRSPSVKKNADLLADLFVTKMTVGNPRRHLPLLDMECNQVATTVEVTREHVERLLRGFDVGKATGPDCASPQALKHCASKLSGSLSEVIKTCLEENS